MIHPWLSFDVEQETNRNADKLRSTLVEFKRRGYVLGVSGGIDSSVTLALCVRALGKDRVKVLQMPERHSASETLPLSELVADHFGVTRYLEDITPILEALQFYRRYGDAIRKAIPDFRDEWKSKLVLHNAVTHGGVSIFHIIVQEPSGRLIDQRLPYQAYLELLAATNFKQRTRKMLEYYYADRFNYAVAGTPNRLEYDQGFFVKLGDGAADVKPIAHLYKTQVYELAEYLGVPEEIRKRPPTTDTYSLPQGQDEFYFALPYEKMDLCLYGKNNGKSPADVAKEIGLSAEQVVLVYKDIDTKRSTTRYLHEAPVLIEKI
jgi:NAD+ synthase